MSRILLALALLVSGVALRAQDAPALHGRVEGRTYVSPTGAFKVAIPVLPELGGEITDTQNVVTFKDDFNVHVSIAVFPQDATQRWEMSTRGTKDYLAYFFANFVLADFRQTFEGVQAETAKYVPSLVDGALLAYILIPGGSMFMDRVAALGPMDKPPVAKRGNLVFVKNGDIYVISTELAERVIEGKAYKKTTAEEDQLLRQRLEDVLSKIQFTKPAPAKPVPAK
jgi:hypothetical protein